MKKIVVTLLLAAILLSVAPFGASLADTTNYASVYSGNQYGVRLRLGPGTTYASQTTLPSGTTVIILEQGAVWSRIQAGTLTGYMMSRYLVAGGASSSSSVQGTATVYAGNGLRTWLRTSPNGKRLGLYSDGTPVSILGTSGEWSKIMIGSNIGYMMTKYLLVPTPTPSPSPVPYTALTSLELNYEYPLVGDALRATLTPSHAEVTYQWYRDSEEGQKLSTAAAYTATNADNGHKILLVVTGTGAWSGQKLEAISQPVTKEKKVVGAMIRNANDEHAAPMVGDTLSAVISPSSATVEYSWRVAGVEKSKEATYTVQAEDSGKQIQLYATGKDGFSGQAASDLTSKVTDTLEITAVSLSTVYPVVGEQLSATVTPASATADFIWYVDGIKVGSGSTYMPTAFDMGKIVTVKATGKDKCVGSAISQADARVKQTNLSKVTLNSTAPVVGMTLIAYAEPAAAVTAESVDYVWYNGSNEKLGEGETFVVPAAALGKSLYVRAYGKGIYGGAVASAITSVVSDTAALNSVSLSVTKPVVGDTIYAESDPDAEMLGANNCLYLWQIGTVTKPVTKDNFYVVTEDDEGKQIRVTLKVKDATVTSAATDKVTGSKAITSAYIYNESTGKNLSNTAPQVGHTLTLMVNPGEAAVSGKVKYTWKSGDTVVGNDSSYVVAESDVDKTLCCVVEPVSRYYLRDDKTSWIISTAKVAKLTAVDVKLNGRVTPKVGESPVLGFSDSVKDQWKYNATVTWAPSLADNGTFLSGVEYTATIRFSFNNGYRLGTVQADDVEGKGTVTGVKVEDGLTVTMDFGKLEAAQDISLFCVYGLDVPTPGATPIQTISNNTQFELREKVKWTNEDGSDMGAVFQSGRAYRATIRLKAKSGTKYRFPDDPTGSLFSVPGASSVTYTKESDTNATVTALFKPVTGSVKAEIVADRTEVSVGVSKKYVACTAYLSGYTGNQDNLNWKWTLANGTRSNTQIGAETGIVTVDPDEKAGLELLVTATVEVAGVDYTASLIIKTVEQSDSSTESPVASIIKSVTELAAGGQTTFVATVKNTDNETVRWTVEGVDGDLAEDTTIGYNSGKLTVSKYEKVKQLKVSAVPVPEGEPAVCYVTVVYSASPLSIEFTNWQKSVAIGRQATFGVAINSDEASPRAVFSAGSQDDVTLTTAADGKSCTVTVPNDPTLVGKEVTLTARYEYTDSASGKTYSVSANQSFIIAEGEGEETIVAPAAVTLKADPASVKLETGVTSYLKAVLDPASGADGYSVKAKITAPAGVTVEYDPATGILTGTNLNDTEKNFTVTLSYENSEGTAGDLYTKVNVPGKIAALKSPTLTVSASQDVLYPGETAAFTASVSPTIPGYSVVWSSDYAGFDVNTQKLTALDATAESKAKVTAVYQYDGVAYPYGTTEVTVEVTLKPQTLSLVDNGNGTYTAKIAKAMEGLDFYWACTSEDANVTGETQLVGADATTSTVGLDAVNNGTADSSLTLWVAYRTADGSRKYVASKKIDVAPAGAPAGISLLGMPESGEPAPAVVMSVAEEPQEEVVPEEKTEPVTMSIQAPAGVSGGLALNGGYIFQAVPSAKVEGGKVKWSCGYLARTMTTSADSYSMTLSLDAYQEGSFAVSAVYLDAEGNELCSASFPGLTAVQPVEETAVAEPVVVVEPDAEEKGDETGKGSTEIDAWLENDAVEEEAEEGDEEEMSRARLRITIRKGDTVVTKLTPGETYEIHVSVSRKLPDGVLNLKIGGAPARLEGKTLYVDANANTTEENLRIVATYSSRSNPEESIVKDVSIPVKPSLTKEKKETGTETTDASTRTDETKPSAEPGEAPAAEGDPKPAEEPKEYDPEAEEDPVDDHDPSMRD